MNNLSLKNILNLILLDKIKIIIGFFIFAIVAVAYSLSLPNIYTARVVVSSNINESSGGLSGSLGGLASMAGISLGGGEMSPEVVKEALASNSFLGEFVQEIKLAEVLFAATNFDSGENKFNYDDSIFNKETGEWVRKFKYPKTQKPSTEEMAVKFKESLTFSFDRKTKLINITFSSLSPKLSKSVLDLLITSFNEHMKEKDQLDAQKTIDYLKGKLNEEKVLEVRLALQQLFEEQLKKLAFTETKAEYALRVLDKPLIPSNKSEPKRAVICVAISVFGTLLLVFILLSFRVYRLDKSKEA